MLDFTAGVLLAFSVLLDGLAYRFRGGWLGAQDAQAPFHVKRGDTISRLVWGFCAGGTAFLTYLLLHAGPFTDDIIHALLLDVVTAVLMFLCSTIGLFHSIDLGHNEGTFWGDFGLLSLRGVLAVLPTAIWFWWMGHPHAWILLLAGSSMAALYWAGRQMKWNIADFGKGGDFPETGEFLFGLAVGVGIVLALV